jgi:hypothetical protein
VLRRACSPGGIAPRIDRPGNRSGNARNDAEVQGQPCGETSGASGIASVVARTFPLQSVPGRSRHRFRPEEAAAGTALRLSGRVEHAVPRHSAPGWQQQAGAGQRHRWEPRAPRPRSGSDARQPACTPGIRRHEWTLWMKHGSWSSASLAMYEGGIAADLRVGRRRVLRQPPRCQRRPLRRCSPACVGVTSHFWRFVLRYGPTEVRDDNGRRETTAVMRHGC